MQRNRWVGAIAVATTCALVGAAGGIATSGAASSTGSTAKAKATTSATSGGRPDFGGRGGGPSVHSESVQMNNAGTAFITITRDEGTVKAVSGSDITLHEGTTTVAYKDVAVTVAAGATITRNDATAALAEIKVGDRVSIEQSSDGTEVRAYDPTFKPAFGGGHRGHGGDDGDGPAGPPRLANPSTTTTTPSTTTTTP